MYNNYIDIDDLIDNDFDERMIRKLDNRNKDKVYNVIKIISEIDSESIKDLESKFGFTEKDLENDKNNVTIQPLSLI